MAPQGRAEPLGPSRLYPISPLPIGQFGSAALFRPIRVLRPLLSDRFQAALIAQLRRRPPWRVGGGTWPGCASPRLKCASGTRCRGAATGPPSASRTGGWRAVVSSCCRRTGPRWGVAGREAAGSVCPHSPWPGRAGVTSSRPASLYESAVGSVLVHAAPRTAPACVNNGSASWEHTSRVGPEGLYPSLPGLPWGTGMQPAHLVVPRPSLRCRTLPEEKCISRGSAFISCSFGGVSAHMSAQLGRSCVRGCLGRCKCLSVFSYCEWKMLPWTVWAAYETDWNLLVNWKLI